MDLNVNAAFGGFIIKEKQEVSDIHGTAYLLEHQKSGARLCYIQTKDDNKVFSISFKTPPEDDCGTPHILEHSVLCGSRKYGAKDPMNELAKGSLNTFLNALTYADKTMYPIASCNEEDFHNLMDVYLDAVFFPSIYEKKEIFMQEGWRYLLDEEKGTLDITGVVYNEMKGALSDPESLLTDAISKSIFQTSVYRFESGGDPAAIPDLCYEKFLNFHRKYYHPSNSYIYLYGDMDFERCLLHLDEDFLSHFERSSALPEILEETVLPKKEIQYETYPTDGTEDRGYLAYSVNVGKCTDETLAMALQVLSYVLLETNASRLKTALLEAGICHEADGWFDASTYEMVFSIIAKNADTQRAEEFQKIIDSTLEKILAEGLDSALLSSSIRRLSFLIKEEDYGTTPKGLIYGMRLMKSWLHGESPFPCLRQFAILKKLQSPDFDWLGILKERILNNPKKSILVFSPDQKKAAANQALHEQKMKKLFSEMDEEALAEIKRNAENLRAFQEKEDTAKVLAQIPLLKLSQINTKSKLPVYTQNRAGERRQIYVPIAGNGILYLRLHFDLDALPKDLLPYAGLLADLFGKLDTAAYSYEKLPLITNEILGGLSFQNDIYSKNTTEYQAFLTLKCKLLREDADKAGELLQEILLHTDFEALAHLKKIVKAEKINSENYLLNYSHLEGIYYSAAQLSNGGKIKELTSGIAYFHFLTEIDSQLEQAPEAVIEKLKETAAFLITADHLNISYACAEEDADIALNLLNRVAEQFPKRNSVRRQSHSFEKNPSIVAFTANSNVQYNVSSAEYHQPYHGSMQVLKTILNLEYLWNAVRIKGGAYGCGCNFQRNGLCYFYSYRDPNLEETYAIYENLWKNIGNFKASAREMTKYILGTINRLDQPKSNSTLLNEVIHKAYSEVSAESEILERTQILETTEQDICAYQSMLKDIFAVSNYCTIGNEVKILDEKDFFQSVLKLIP